MALGRDDDGAFQERCVACLDGLYAFAVSLCRDRSLAEDLVQEACLRALRASRHPAPTDEVRPWLFTILHNIWRNHRRGRIVERLDALPDGYDPALSVRPHAEDALDRAAAADEVERAIGQLPDAYREVVMLRFGQGLSYREIAQVLECPAGTVMSRLARARAQIRQAVEGAGLLRVVGGRP